jgi:hypothetical protein
LSRVPYAGHGTPAGSNVIKLFTTVIYNWT